MLIGYIRVSSNFDRQSTDLQRDALLTAEVDPQHSFEDKPSGARGDRPGLKEVLSFIHARDTLVVIHPEFRQLSREILRRVTSVALAQSQWSLHQNNHTYVPESTLSG